MKVKCIDTSGIVDGEIIKVLGSTNRKTIRIGDRVLIVVRSINLKSRVFEKKRQKRRMRKGSIHRAMVIQTKRRFYRSNKTWISFFDNCVVMINKKNFPYAKRIKGIVPLEIARKIPRFGSISGGII